MIQQIICKAFPSLKVGMKVKTNGDYSGITTAYTGVITCLDHSEKVFHIDRNDKREGKSCETKTCPDIWQIRKDNSVAWIEYSASIKIKAKTNLNSIKEALLLLKT